jgi:hypothetical protein
VRRDIFFSGTPGRQTTSLKLNSIRSSVICYELHYKFVLYYNLKSVFSKLFFENYVLFMPTPVILTDAEVTASKRLKTIMV